MIGRYIVIATLPWVVAASVVPARAAGDVTVDNRAMGNQAMDGRNHVSVRDFGAVCDGHTDDTDALRRAFAYRNYHVELPAGETCAFAVAPLVIDRPYGSIEGAGMWGTSRLLYTGTATNVDLLQVGRGTTKADGVTSTGYTVLRGFTLESATKMTGGFAIHEMGTQFVSLQDIALGRQQDPVNLWGGFHFDQIDYTRLQGFFVTAQDDCLAVSGLGAEGRPATGPQYDLWVDGGKIGGCHIGVHVGGGFDGAFFDHIEDTTNDYDIVVDDALSPHPNQEVLFGSQFFADFARWDSVLINDPLCTQRIYCSITLDGPIVHAVRAAGVAPGWRAGAPAPRDSGHGIHIKAYPSGYVLARSPYMQFHAASAVYDEDQRAYLVMSATNLVNRNGGGIWATAPWSRVLSSPLFLDNTGPDLLNVEGGTSGARVRGSEPAGMERRSQ